MRRLFPRFNAQERVIVEGVPAADRPALADGLRALTLAANEPR
jgi:hypothetical protein